MSELESEGVIERIQGRGTFVTTVQRRQAQKQLDMFALIAPQLREGMYPSLVHGFEEAGADCQHQVVVSNSQNDTDRQGNLVLQMIHRAVGGVALVPSTFDSTPAFQIQQLQMHHIPVVFCHRSVEGVSAPCVTWDARDVGRAAGQLLWEHGHRNIAGLFTHPYFMTSEYEQGLRDVMSRDALSADNVRAIYHGGAFPGKPAAAAIHRALEEMFAQPAHPTAVFCGNLPDAEQVYLQANALGLMIPRDLSLIYFGGTWREHGLAERISCVAVDEHGIGARAAELLHEMRTGKRAIDNDERIVFPVTVWPGETVAEAPGGGVEAAISSGRSEQMAGSTQ
jgi:DNA-binding LacI/PurR family transcriptional regulator